MPDTEWYKDVVIYELPVKAFFDANNDGYGDFAGVTQKLDYLQYLGVDCIGCCRSTSRRYAMTVMIFLIFMRYVPSLVLSRTFQFFMMGAKNAGMKVLADLVLNHTSTDIPGSRQRGRRRTPRYTIITCGATIQPSTAARVSSSPTPRSQIGRGTKRHSNTWHRFFSHQPDLNYDNLDVREEMISVMRFWLETGLDGFRCDAVPYLFEREGTNNENLAETHVYLKEIRKYLDDHYPDKILLAEANQWPEDLLPYFGNGDEFHMAFNFPLMPRLFMSLRLEDRKPVIDIISRLPEIPANCQWGIFLRNHDELTLEMVTDEKRDYMYNQYAKDPRMKINLGIRRRLAPLVDNDRKEMELLTRCFSACRVRL